MFEIIQNYLRLFKTIQDYPILFETIVNHLKSLKNVKLCKIQGENVNFKGGCNNVQKNVH